MQQSLLQNLHSIIGLCSNSKFASKAKLYPNTMLAHPFIFKLQNFPLLEVNSLWNKIFLIPLANSLCFTVWKKWTSKFPVFPVPWQRCFKNEATNSSNKMTFTEPPENGLSHWLRNVELVPSFPMWNRLLVLIQQFYAWECLQTHRHSYSHFEIPSSFLILSQTFFDHKPSIIVSFLHRDWVVHLYATARAFIITFKTADKIIITNDHSHGLVTSPETDSGTDSDSGFLSYTDIGNRDPSPSLCNAKMFCIVQMYSSESESEPESVYITVNKPPHSTVSTVVSALNSHSSKILRMFLFSRQGTFHVYWSSFTVYQLLCHTLSQWTLDRPGM